jgi:hypothetical protein
MKGGEMSKYGIYLGITVEPEIFRFYDEQTGSHKAWISAIKDSINAPDAAILHRNVWLPEIVDPSKGMLVNIYGDPEALWDQVSLLNRNATALLDELDVKSFLVGCVVILPASQAEQGSIMIEGWDRSDASRALELVNKHLFYHRKYNYKRRHEFGGAPSHPQLDGRGA